MKKIVCSDTYSFVYLNASFYSLQSIKEALKVYKEYCTTSLSKFGKYRVIRLEPHEPSQIQEITHEFLNFALAKEFEIRT